MCHLKFLRDAVEPFRADQCSKLLQRFFNVLLSLLEFVQEGQTRFEVALLLICGCATDRVEKAAQILPARLCLHFYT